MISKVLRRNLGMGRTQFDLIHERLYIYSTEIETRLKNTRLPSIIPTISLNIVSKVLEIHVLWLLYGSDVVTEMIRKFCFCDELHRKFSLYKNIG
jgi:hypothetical protein